MDFSISSSMQELTARFRDFVQREVMPLEARLAESWSALEPALRELRARAKAAGLWAPQLPRELGGLQLPLEEFALVSEELGRSPLGHYVFTRRRGLGPPNCVQVVSRIAENRVNSGGLAWTRSCPQLGEVSEESSNDGHLPD